MTFLLGLLAGIVLSTGAFVLARTEPAEPQPEAPAPRCIGPRPPPEPIERPRRAVRGRRR